MNKKRGVSLVILLIVIAVMIIISSSVILNLSDTDGQISQAQESKLINDISVLKDELAMRLSLEKRVNFDDIDVELDETMEYTEALNKKKEQLIYYMPSIELGKLDNDIMYSDILTIQDGELVLYTSNQLKNYNIEVEEEVRTIILRYIDEYKE